MKALASRLVAWVRAAFADPVVAARLAAIEQNELAIAEVLRDLLAVSIAGDDEVGVLEGNHQRFVAQVRERQQRAARRRFFEGGGS